MFICNFYIEFKIEILLISNCKQLFSMFSFNTFKYLHNAYTEKKYRNGSYSFYITFPVSHKNIADSSVYNEFGYVLLSVNILNGFVVKSL